MKNLIIVNIFCCLKIVFFFACKAFIIPAHWCQVEEICEVLCVVELQWMRVRGEGSRGKWVNKVSCSVEGRTCLLRFFSKLIAAFQSITKHICTQRVIISLEPKLIMTDWIGARWSKEKSQSNNTWNQKNSIICRWINYSFLITYDCVSNLVAVSMSILFSVPITRRHAVDT